MENTLRRKRNRMLLTLGVVAGLSLVALTLIGASYPLFYTLIELAVAIVAIAVFTIAWHTRSMSSSGYVTLIGLACLPIGAVTVLHTLAYKGMPVFPGYGSNLPTQFWVIARLVQGAAFAIAPVFLRRPLKRPALALAAFSLVTVAAVWAAFARVFPAAFVEGQGLTSFKIAMEYLAVGLTVLGAAGLYRYRANLASDVAVLLWASMACMVIAELAFTLYADPFGPANRAGHAAYFAAFLLIYAALVQASLERPVETLFHEIRRREAALALAYATEHEIAETLQNAMTIQPVRVPGLRVAHRYLPSAGAGRIGGDFYDLFPIVGGLVGFTIGDVCGRGLAAASLTMKTRSALRAVALDDPDPAHVLESVNSFLTRETPSDSFVTAVFGTIDTQTGHVRVAVAGHPEPIICGRPDATFPDELRSPPLGVQAGLGVGVWRFDLRPGESLVLITDGVLDAGEVGAHFGAERLLEVVHGDGHDGTATELVETLLKALSRHAGVHLTDDIAIVALQRD